jgi:hypothetical protein
MLGGIKETDNAAEFEYDMKAITHVVLQLIRTTVIVTTTTKRINDEAMAHIIINPSSIHTYVTAMST